MKVDFKLEGMADLSKKLLSLPTKEMKAIQRRGVRKGSTHLAERVKPYAPVDTGEMKESIIARKSKRRQPPNVVADIVGPTALKDTSHIIKKGKNKGKNKQINYGYVVAAKDPWLRIAHDANANEAADIALESIGDDIVAWWGSK